MAARYTRLALLLVLFSAAPGNSQDRPVEGPRDPQIIEKLGYVVTAAAMVAPTNENVDAVMKAARGGNNTGIPLGCYIVCPYKREFTSDYVHESAGAIVSWTYDLHMFLSNKDHPYDLDYLPTYKIVRDFAAKWWKKNSEAFEHRPSMHQSAWVYEAILDGVQIWDRYAILDGTLSASGILYFDAVLATYQNASPSEIFF
jgi:hypothetical protein